MILYFCTLPYALNLFLITYLLLVGFHPSNKLAKSHASFLSKAFTSSMVNFFQSLFSFEIIASLIVIGSSLVVDKEEQKMNEILFYVCFFFKPISSRLVFDILPHLVHLLMLSYNLHPLTQITFSCSSSLGCSYYLGTTLLSLNIESKIYSLFIGSKACILLQYMYNQEIYFLCFIA